MLGDRVLCLDFAVAFSEFVGFYYVIYASVGVLVRLV